MAENRLPAVIAPYGPLGHLSVQVHELTVKGRHTDALVAADDNERIVNAFGDERTGGFILQGRMYALLSLGRLQEALSVGEALLRRHRASGYRLGEAKILADLAGSLVKLGRTDEGLHTLARALEIMERVPPSNLRYCPVLSSIGEAARAAELFELADECTGYALRTLAVGSAEYADIRLQRAELLLEWALRLEQLGEVDEAQTRYRASVSIVEDWIDGYGSYNGYGQVREGEMGDAPLATALLALGRAKSGDTERAAGLAVALIERVRAAGQFHEARLAHLAYGTALRRVGDLAGARREFTAAEELSVQSGQTAERLIYRYELATLAVQEYPTAGGTSVLEALRDQALSLWRLRLERRTMLAQARRRVQLEEANDTANLAAVQDALTGLGNRRSFDRYLAAIDRRTGDTGAVVLMLVDVDHFKLINDRYSHGVGDLILREVAVVLQANCRAEDVPVRFGGDEFAIFLRADLSSAACIGERIRAQILARDWAEFGVGLAVTLSMGASPLADGMSGQDLFDAADRNLYVAKRQGRNQLAAA